jgi:hypothetical protein
VALSSIADMCAKQAVKGSGKIIARPDVQDSG